jgi:hypothetical protein
MTPMTQRQRLARAAPERKHPDVFPSPEWRGTVWRWVPGIFIGDGAQAQENAWRNVFMVPSNAQYVDAIDAAKDAYTAAYADADIGELLNSAPPEICQSTHHMLEWLRIYCQFHMSFAVKKGTFVANKDNVKLICKDIARVAKDIAFPWMKSVVMDALVTKWRSKSEPQVADWLETWRDKTFTYVEANVAAVGGGVPNTNVAQEAKNR